MLHKFKTDTCAVAFKATSGMPADYARTVERDIQALIHMYNAMFCRGKRDEFVQSLSISCLREMRDILATLPPEVQALMKNPSGPTPAQAAIGVCILCGGTNGNHDASKH